MSGGYQGSVDYYRFARNVRQVLRRGVFSHAKTNTRGEFVGVGACVQTFAGLRADAKGALHFYHYDKRVLSIDTVQGLCTDYGMHGRSLTTGTNVRRWAREALDMLHGEVPYDHARHSWWAWTGQPPKRLGWMYRELWRRYREGAAWLVQRDGYVWVNLRTIPDDAGREWWSSWRALRSGERHWFTYDWNAAGEWVRRYIDDAAKARHEAWQRRQQRAKAKAALAAQTGRRK